MPSMEATLSSILDTPLMPCVRWHGTLVANALPRREMTKQYRSGMQQMETTFLSTGDILLPSIRWPGLPMAGILPQLVVIRWSRSGIRRAESSPSSTMGIMTMCLPWPGRPMADILPRPVVIRRYRSGMHLVAGISLPIGDTPMAWVLWRGYQMADTLFQPVMIQLRRCGKRNETNHQAVYPSVKHEKKEQAYVFSSDLPANNKKERPVTSAGAIPICLWHNTCSNIPHCDAIRPGARDSDGGCNSHGECSYTFYPACDIQRTPGERHQSSLVA